MHSLYLLAALAIIFATGLCLGMSLQWQRDSKRIAALEESCMSLADLLTSPDDEGFDDDFDQDDPEYVAGVEATLRAWAEADKADEAISRPIYNEGNLL